MRKIMKSGSFELGTDGVGIDVTSHDDAVTFYAPLTAEQRRALADALVPGRDFSGVDWKVMYDRACRERDKWEEKYLDTDEALHKARASLHEACKVAQSYKVDAYQATERAEAAEREWDKWKARAEAADRDRDDDYSERSQKAAAWDRVAAHPALRMDLLPEADHTYAGGVLERITQLAEAEQAVDPVEEKARELYRAATPDARWETVADEYRRIARHVTDWYVQAGAVQWETP